MFPKISEKSQRISESFREFPRISENILKFPKIFEKFRDFFLETREYPSLSLPHAQMLTVVLSAPVDQVLSAMVLNALMSTSVPKELTRVAPIPSVPTLSVGSHVLAHQAWVDLFEI